MNYGDLERLAGLGPEGPRHLVCPEPADWPSVREINEHLICGTGYCYVRLKDGHAWRIGRARRVRGVLQGRIISGSERTWEVIPADAVIELS